jgi:DNA repair protein RadA/Sms
MVVGEVGLAGEVRAVTHPEIRVKEAAKLGFTRCILPAGSLKHVRTGNVELIGVTSVEQTLENLFLPS